MPTDSNTNVAKGTHRAEGASLLPKAKTSHHRFYKDTLPGDCHVAMLLAMT